MSLPSFFLLLPSCAPRVSSVSTWYLSMERLLPYLKKYYLNEQVVQQIVTSLQDYSEWWGSYRSGRLLNASAPKWLYVCIEVSLLFWKVKTPSRHYNAVVTFSLHIYLRVLGYVWVLLHPRNRKRYCRACSQTVNRFLSILMKVSHMEWHIDKECCRFFASNWFWQWVLFVSFPRTITLCWFQVLLLDCDPKISMAINSRGPAARMSCSFLLCVI